MTRKKVDIAAAKALSAAATPGPWESDGDYDRAEVCQTMEPFVTIVGTETEGRAYMSYERLVLSAADAKFIAESRTLVDDLIEEVEDLRAEVKKLKIDKYNQVLVDMCDDPEGLELLSFLGADALQDLKKYLLTETA